MKIKCKIIKKVFDCPAYQILGAIPIENGEQILLNSYGNFTIKDNTLMLSEDKEYTVELKEENGARGITYEVVSIPSLQLQTAEEIDDSMEYNILCEITTQTLAKQINENYPNYIRLILDGKQDEIDLKKIKGVKIVRHNLFCRLINEKFKYFYLMDKNRKYELTMVDCKELCTIYPIIEMATEQIELNPYYCLICICKRSFTRVDNLLSKIRPDLNESDQRTEFMMLDVLSKNESEGSTYMDANEMAQYCKGIDERLVNKLKPVAIESALIYYEESSKRIALQSTYMAECTISNFIKDKLCNSTLLDWDWKKFTKIKNGTLTEEQSNFLKEFCQYNFLVLDSAAGSGKTTCLSAILDMCDAYHYSYCCLAFTGKASSKMSQQTGRKASTIHRKTLSGNITEDVVIVDEYSMLSIDLMMMIIRSISNPHIRVLFVGDSEQIMNLGTGRIAKDLLESEIVPKCAMTYCFRFKEGGASYVSALTRQRKFYLTDEQCEQSRVVLGKEKDYTYVKFDGTQDQILEEYMKLIHQGIKPNDICVLIPQNVGEFGATAINNIIQSEINPPKPNELIMKTEHNKTPVYLKKGDLIMNIKNDYSAINLESYNMMYDEWGDDTDLTLDDLPKTSVFNGQIGTVLSINDKVLSAQIDEEIIVFNKIKCYNLLLSYATNPFKFQGSSCKYIINLIIPQHKRMLNYQLIYTSQTRQEAKLIEIGDIETMKEGVRTIGDENRKTFLKELLLDNKNLLC